MARQDDAAVNPGPDRGEDRGLVAGGIRRAAGLESMATQIALDKVEIR
jgi:hypothetical protein